VGFELDYGVDACGAWAEATPVLGFTRLPPVSVGYRRPGKCREDDKPIKDSKPELPEEWKNAQPDSLPPGFRADDLVVAATTTTSIFVETRTINGQKLSNVSSYQGKIHSVVEPTTAIAASPPGGIYYPPATALASGSVSWTITLTGDLATVVNRTYYPPQNTTYARNFAIHPGHPKQGVNGGWFEGNSGALGGKGDYIGIGWTQVGEGVMAAVYYGKFGAIFPSSKLPFSVGISPDGVYSSFFKVNLAYLKKISGSPDTFPPPVDQRKRRRCCMQCCSSGSSHANKQNQDLSEIKKLLREIKKNQGSFPFNVQLFDADENKPGSQAKNVKVSNIADGLKTEIERTEKTSKMIGIDQFPMKLPKSVMEPKESSLIGNVLSFFSPKSIRVTSVAQLNWWMFEQLHSILGHWQESIDIEDADAVKEGEQPERVILPNVALTMKESINLQTNHMKATGLILDCILKVLIDLAGTKVLTAECAARIKDIQEYLDYPTNEKPGNVPTQISPPKSNATQNEREDLHKFLKPSHTNFVFDDWTGEHSLEEKLTDLLQAVAVLRGGS
jgi:hypothetical protein